MRNEIDVDALLSELPPAYETAIRMRDRGAGPQEIADRLEIPVESVETTLQIARSKLDRLVRRVTPGSDPDPSGR